MDATQRRHARRETWAVLAASALAAAVIVAVLPRSAAKLTAGLADPGANPAGHARQARQLEIRQRFEQAVVMLHARQYEHAITALHRVLELDPQLPEAHVNMGFALLGAERHRAARDFFESATALRPMQTNAYYGMALALQGEGDAAGAIGAMRTYLHLAAADDPYLAKARTILQEWESKKSAAPGNPEKNFKNGKKQP